MEHGFAYWLSLHKIDLQGSTALTQLTLVDMCLAMWNLAIGVSQKYCFFVFNIKNWHAALPLQEAALRGDEMVLCIPPGSPDIVFTRPHADSIAKSNSVFLLKILVMFLWSSLTIR